MTHWLDVFLYELRQMFRRKAYQFITFGVPLLAIAAFYGYQIYHDAQGGNDEPANPLKLEDTSRKLGYVDRTPDGLFPPPDSYPKVDCKPSGTEITPALIRRLSSPYCLRGTVFAFETRAAGEKALDAQKIDVLYVIEPTYRASGDVSLYMSGLSIENAGSDTLMQDYLLRSLLYKVEDPASYERLYLRLRDPAVIREHRLDAGAVQESNENRNILLVYVFGLVLMMSIFWGGGYLMQSVVQEKESRIIEIILSSVRPTALLLGKILAMGLLSLLQVFLLLGAFVYIASQGGSLTDALADVEISAFTLALVGVYFVLGFLLFGSLMASIGALSTSVRESQNFVVVVTLPAVIPFFFLTMFAEEPNGALATALSIIPITAPMSMVMRLAVTDVPGGELALSLILLALAVMAVIWLAGRLFRVRILLMGTTPKLRDLPRLFAG
jgi:ABC-2 type transport system permease protein